MLTLKNIEGGYLSGRTILTGIDLKIPEGETLAIIGQNGSGKSTLAKAVINTLPFRNGEIWLERLNITGFTTMEIVKSGIGIFIQGGKVFPHLTIKENLLLAGRTIRKHELNLRLDELSGYFVSLKDKTYWNMQASYLSGGERNSLALAMVLLARPKLLILDEPSAGLSVANTKAMYQTLTALKRHENMSIMLIEQNVKEAVEFSETVALLQNGKILKIIKREDETTIDYIKNSYFINN